MTDKEQIIIDGVDITGCVNCLRFCKTTKKPEAICKIYGYCSKKTNCLYKQLARKTQECEQKDERIIELTKEYQRLNEQKDKADKTISDLIGCVSLWEQFSEEESKLAKDSSIADLIMLLRKKTQECEELKKQLAYLTTYRKQNQTCQECYEDGYNVGKYENKELNRYRKALEEIEAVCRADTYTFADGTQIRYDSLNDILDVINKAKGEGENDLQG